MTDNSDIEKVLEDILKGVAQSEMIQNYEVIVDTNRAQGDGFLSEFYLGKLFKKDNKQTIHVAIKKAPSASLPGFGYEMFYKNEKYFYSQLFPKLNKFQKERGVSELFDNIPKYFTGNDSDNMFIAMENLLAGGYVLFEKKQYLDKKHLEMIFKIYGKFHALSLAFKQSKPDQYTNLLEKFPNTFEKMFENSDLIMGTMLQSYTSALDSFDPVLEMAILEKLKGLDVKKTFLDAAFYKGNYTCLIHGDCWTNNMLFKYKKSGELEDIKIIDFQMAHIGTPIHDLSYFFYSAAAKEDMDKLDFYIDVYYKSFLNFAEKLDGNPEQLLPINIFKEEWKKYSLLGLFQGLQMWVTKLMDKDEIIALMNKNDIPADKIWEVWGQQMAKVRKREDFRERAKNIILHGVEYGIL